MKLKPSHKKCFSTRLLKIAALSIAILGAGTAAAGDDFGAELGLDAIDVGRIPDGVAAKKPSRTAKKTVPTRGETFASVFTEPTREVQKPLVAAPSQATEKKSVQLTITLTGKSATINPSSLSFDEIGAMAAVAIHLEDGTTAQTVEGLQLFVRNQAAVVWNPQANTLKAQREGQTELYLIWQGQMVIVPVTVSTATHKTDVEVPESLVSLGNLLDKSAGAPHASYADTASSLGAKLSVRTSAEEAQETLRQQAADASRYRHVAEESRFKTLVLQVMDERSIPESGLVYPVHDAQVRVSGTDFYAASDATGMIRISDVPVGGRILVQIYDRDGQFQPTVQELHVSDDPAEEVMRVKLLQRSMFDVYARANQLAQSGNLASVCGRATANGQAGIYALDGVSVALNVEADGPYYFNRYGPDPYAKTTDEFGRFCFFNVQPGLVELSVYENGALSGALTVPLFGGRHLEDDFVFSTAPAWSTRLAVAAPALDQLFEGSERADRYETQDAVELTLIGENEPMEREGMGLMATEAGTSVYRDRAYALNQGAEFEPTLYAYDMGEEDLVTPLFPRGFAEDLFRELYLQDSQASVAYDPSLGSVVVHTGLRNGMSANDVTVKLLDGYGREIEGGWYFGSDTRDVVKAVFFNIPPGVYTVLAETQNGHWLDVTTVAVDYWTLSYARLGTKLRYSQ